MQAWLDTHLHLLCPERLHYDWAAGIPALEKRFPLEEYLAFAQTLGITATLHMEVDVRAEEIERETQLVEEFAPLVNACPNTVFVLNHCGVPDIAGGGLQPRKQILPDWRNIRM